MRPSPSSNAAGYDPEGVTLEDFVAAGGKAPVLSARPETVTAGSLFDHYLQTHANGTSRKLAGHLADAHHQFTETVGERFRIQGLTQLDSRGTSTAGEKKASPPSP